MTVLEILALIGFPVLGIGIGIGFPPSQHGGQMDEGGSTGGPSGDAYLLEDGSGYYLNEDGSYYLKE